MTTNKVSVSIEYCGSWGYYGRFIDLKNEIESNASNVDVTGFEGRQGSFEVSINNKVVFSKLATYGFPYPNDIIQAVNSSEKGEDVDNITNSQSPCIIL